MIPATVLTPGLPIYYVRGQKEDSIGIEGKVLEVGHSKIKIRVSIAGIWHDKLVTRANLFRRNLN